MALRGYITGHNTSVGANSGAISLTTGWTGSAPQSGDIIVLDFGIDKTSAAPSFSGSTFNAISGASDMNVAGADGTCSFGVRSQVYNGSDSSVTLSTSGSHWYSVTMRAYSGRSATPFAVTPAVTGPIAQSGTPVSLSITGLTANAGDDLVLFVGVNQSAGGTDTYTFTQPSGYANSVTDQQPSATNSTNQSSCDEVNVSSGATGTLTGTLASSGEQVAYGAYLISLAQAAAAGSTAPIAWIT